MQVRVGGSGMLMKRGEMEFTLSGNYWQAIWLTSAICLPAVADSRNADAFPAVAEKYAVVASSKAERWWIDIVQLLDIAKT